MQTTENNFPIFENEDLADLNLYSEQLAEALELLELARKQAEDTRNKNEQTRVTEFQTIKNENQDMISDLEEKRDSGFFKGDKGEKGEQGEKGEIGETGNGIKSIILKSGSHLSGQYDTYLITFTDETTSEIVVYNGKDGEGAGDMITSVYDKDRNGIVDNAEKVNNYSVNSDVPENAKFTDTTYSNATTTVSGLMSSLDKSKLNGIEEEANNYILPISNTSTLGGIKIGSGLEINSDGTTKIKDINSTAIVTTVIITANTDYEIPEYTLGNNSLSVFFEGIKLIKNEHYVEVDTTHIQFKDWDVPIGSHLEFIYR